MKGWRECKLGDVVDIIPGFAFKSQHFSDYIGDAKVIKITDILPPVIDINNSMFVNLSAYDKKKLEKYIIKKKDFVVAMTGATIGKIGRMQTDEIAYINQRVATFRAKENTISDFVYYLINCPEFQAFIQNNIDSNSDQENISATSISRFPILLPPLPEQKAITAVLSSLDDKIDLLHRQNKTLEAMAETLFRQWFVEPCKNGLPEGWEEKSLEECVNIGIGRTPPRQEYQWFTEDPKGIKWISIKDLGNNGVYIFDTDENLTHEAVEKFNIPIIPKDTVVLSFKMTIGRVGITSEDMVSNEAIAHFKFNQKTPFSLEYLYLFLKLYQYDTLGSTSSIVTAINSNMIKQITILIPENTIMDRFNHFVAPLFKKIRENQIQIYTLEKLRDLLLPKLMSGEVRVEYNGD